MRLFHIETHRGISGIFLEICLSGMFILFVFAILKAKGIQLTLLTLPL